MIRLNVTPAWEWDCAGEAKIVSPYRAKSMAEKITTPRIVIATGARPFVPPIKGVEAIGHLTSDNIWQLQEQPARLLVAGAGPIGCELAQSFCLTGIPGYFAGYGA